MSEDMVERVARVIGGLLYGYVDPDDTPRTWKRSVDVAIAAIEEMRTPTPAMLDAGPPEPYMDADVWAKMVDAALSPPLPVGENND